MIDIEGQLLTDQTGCFPISSNCGNNYSVIFYAVYPNYIKSYSIKSRHHIKLLKAYKDVYQFLRLQGYHPKLHKLDNETLKDEESNAKFQYTPPDIHHINTAEHAIQTWKNPFCKDLEQTDITLNMLCPCTTDPLLSAYKALVGMFSFDRTPMAPIGTKIMIHIKPAQHQT
ncbi:hypothetical protein ACHAW6_004814 [Cyclotella cf. meneghiniana]